MAWVIEFWLYLSSANYKKIYIINIEISSSGNEQGYPTLKLDVPDSEVYDQMMPVRWSQSQRVGVDALPHAEQGAFKRGPQTDSKIVTIV